MNSSTRTRSPLRIDEDLALLILRELDFPRRGGLFVLLGQVEGQLALHPLVEAHAPHLSRCRHEAGVAHASRVDFQALIGMQQDGRAVEILHAQEPLMQVDDGAAAQPDLQGDLGLQAAQGRHGRGCAHLEAAQGVGLGRDRQRALLQFGGHPIAGIFDEDHLAAGAELQPGAVGAIDDRAGAVAGAHAVAGGQLHGGPSHQDPALGPLALDLHDPTASRSSPGSPATAPAAVEAYPRLR